MQTAKQKIVAELNRCMKEENHTAYTLSKLCEKRGKPCSTRSINQYRSKEAFSIDQIENLLNQMGYEIEIIVTKKGETNG
jgi:hypothetical protein